MNIQEVYHEIIGAIYHLQWQQAYESNQNTQLQSSHRFVWNNKSTAHFLTLDSFEVNTRTLWPRQRDIH